MKRALNKEEREKEKAERLAKRDAKLKAQMEKRGGRIKQKPLNLSGLIATLPKPANPKDRSTFIHKNGVGMKFFRKIWRYPEPCFW